jgi:hypothetical protein
VPRELALSEINTPRLFACHRFALFVAREAFRMLTKRDLLRSATLTAIGTVAAKFGLARDETSTERPSFSAVRDIAEAGFIYGLPIVMNYGIMYAYAVDRSSGQFKARFNEIANDPNVFTYKDTAVVTPNSDTPYSILFMDLRTQPLVLGVPAVERGRYYSVMLCDGNTYNYGYIGSRATGNEAGDYMVVGPDWKGPTPPGMKKVFRSSTQFSAAAYRTQLFDAEDIDNVRKIQAGYKVETLSAYLKRPAPPAAPNLDFPRFSKELMKTSFFEYLDFALQFGPTEAKETEIRAKLARIGVGPGKTLNFKDLPAKDKLEIAAGMKAGERKVDDAVARAGTGINGWRVGGLAGGDSAHYNGDWLTRAAVARAGIYANDIEEAAYPSTRSDSDGQMLDGRHKYTLIFPPGLLPPVNAFWSVTMYDGKTQLLIKNPINRYLINSPMLPDLQKNADGSLTIYIQNKSPGADKEANWLPAPDGPIYLVMRLYWPKTVPPSILPAGEGTWRPPGVQRVS